MKASNFLRAAWSVKYVILLATAAVLAAIFAFAYAGGTVHDVARIKKGMKEHEVTQILRRIPDRRVPMNVLDNESEVCTWRMRDGDVVMSFRKTGEVSDILAYTMTPRQRLSRWVREHWQSPFAATLLSDRIWCQIPSRAGAPNGN
jgi:hypothetical protein